jgi:hypothetical protein
MSYHWTSNARPGPPRDAQHIHAADCDCSDCCLDRRPFLRRDLTLIGLAMLAAAVVGAVLELGGF